MLIEGSAQCNFLVVEKKVLKKVIESDYVLVQKMQNIVPRSTVRNRRPPRTKNPFRECANYLEEIQSTS